jgi:hypothetical protein
MADNKYLQHFKDQAAGKIPKDQKFYMVDPDGGIKANDIIKGYREQTSNEKKTKRKIKIVKIGHNG